MKKFFIFALVAVLSISLFVACDNETAFTEILETAGAFVVNGKGYDSLQDAVDAVANAKLPAPPKITMTRDVAGRGASIPEDAYIELDLGGNKLTLTDVKEAGLFVDKNAVLGILNGSVTLLDDDSDLCLVKAVASYRLDVVCAERLVLSAGPSVI